MKLGRKFAILAITSFILVILLSLFVLRQPTHSRICQGELRTVNWSGKNLAGIDCARQILREANLSKANLSGANLRDTDFSGAATYLDDANLQAADLTQALLRGTSAIRANFARANLTETDLSDANLNGADLTGANLQGAILTGAKLIAANLTDLQGTPIYLDNADLTDAEINFSTPGLRLCNTTMPDGNVSKQGCFTPSYALTQAVAAKNWRSMDQDMSLMFLDAFSPPKPKESNHQPTTAQIGAIPCIHLQQLDQLWRKASGDRFGFSIQRQIWESSTVNQNYDKFGETVGWKQKTWLKFLDLPTQTASTALPVGMFPWHGWQVQEPTPQAPTRFRRVGFGAWMSRIKACGL